MKVAPDRIALFGAVLVLLGGYLGIYRPSEAALAERYAHLDDGRAALARREQLALRALPLRAEQRALAARLAASGIDADRTAIVERFLHLAAARADEEGVHVGAIAADLVPPATTPPFDAIPLTVSLRGSYARLIRFVRDLARDDVAARVAIVALDEPGPRGAARPELRATLRVTLLHLAHSLEGGDGGTI